MKLPLPSKLIRQDHCWPLVPFQLSHCGGLPPYPDTAQEGFKLLEEIISLSPQTKVIIITGNAEKENAVQAIALGAVDFCTKPIDLKLLNIILSRAFKIYELEVANRRLQRHTFQGGSFAV